MVLIGIIAAWVTALMQGPVAVPDSIRSRLYVQGELTWYGDGPATDLTNRVMRIQALRRIGFGGTRLPFEWVAVERVRGHQDWARLDSTIDELKRDSVRAYGIIAYSPRWAVPDGVARFSQYPSHRPVVDGSSAKGDTLFAAFAAAAARRYGNYISQWEIWNEENLPAFWMNVVAGRNQGADPSDYAHLFTVARDSILAANPAAQVAIGGLSSLDGHNRPWPDPLDSTRRLPAMPPEAYLRALVGSGVTFSAIGLHPYSTVPPGTQAFGRGVIFPDLVIDTVQATLNALGLHDVHVWVTEWGVNAPFARSQEALDAWYRDALSDLLCRPRIEFVTVHTLMDVNPAQHFGLLAADGTEREDGTAFRRWLAGWNGCPAK